MYMYVREKRREGIDDRERVGVGKKRERAE